MLTTTAEIPSTGLPTTGTRHWLLWRSELPKGQTFVYFIQGDPGHPIKVGYTNRVGQRLREHQTSAWEELRLLCVVPAPPAVESAYHRELADEKIRGEWFSGPRTDDLLCRTLDIADQMVCAYDGSGRTPDIYEFDPTLGRQPFGPKSFEPEVIRRPQLTVAPRGPSIPMVDRSVKSRLRVKPWKPDPTPPEGDVPWGRKPPAWYGETRREPRHPAEPPPFGKTNFT